MGIGVGLGLGSLLYFLYLSFFAGSHFFLLIEFRYPGGVAVADDKA